MSFPKNPFVPKSLEQAINPWSWWFDTAFNTHASDNQNGLINITTYKSANPSLEHKITHEVAGYGMQLDVLEETVEMMIGFLPKSKLTAEQKKTISRFEKMMSEIRTHKEAAAVEQIISGGLERLISNLEMLKDKDPALYDQVSGRLKEVL
ncbi:MAG: hypothetical protein ACRBDL_11355 [Alphaproteobacteria bacterium]